MGSIHQALLMASAGVVAEAAAIYSALVSWWPLNDNAASPTYVDEHASNDMTLRTGGSTVNTDTINGIGGIQGENYSHMVNTNDRCAYIPRSNTAMDQTNSDFTFGLWCKLFQEDGGTAVFVMGRLGDTGISPAQPNPVIGIFSGNLTARAVDTDVTYISTAGTPNYSDTEWQLVAFTFNRTANQIELRHRRPGANSGNLTKQTAAFAAALYTTANAANFTISEGLASDTSFFSSNRSAINSAAMGFYMGAAMTDDQFNYLYNSGSGRTYAQLVADATP